MKETNMVFKKLTQAAVLIFAGVAVACGSAPEKDATPQAPPKLESLQSEVHEAIAASTAKHSVDGKVQVPRSEGPAAAIALRGNASWTDYYWWGWLTTST